jgi:hypothetical protein
LKVRSKSHMSNFFSSFFHVSCIFFKVFLGYFARFSPKLVETKKFEEW